MKVIFAAILLLSLPSVVLAEESVFALMERGDVDGIVERIQTDPMVVLSTTEDEAKNQPIHVAAQKCSIPLLQTFINGKADLNVKNYYGHTPLMIAAGSCPLDVVKFLIENSADPKVATDQDGFTALHFAMRQGEAFDIIDYLLSQGADLNAVTRLHQTTPLINAIKYGHMDLVRYLLEKGADASIGQPVYELIQLGSATPAMIDLLLEHKADINAANPIAGAIAYGKIDLARYLIEQGADINQAEALAHAAAYGDMDLVKYLVEQGADINAGNRTPLMQAAQAGHLSIVKYLLEKEADINMLSVPGEQTALSLAIWNGHKIVTDVLIKNGAAKTVFSDAMLGEIDRLEKYGLEELLASQDALGRIPLMAAIVGRQKKAVEFLLSKGADVNARTSTDQMSALHMAVDLGHREIVRLLLDSGADITAQMNESLYVRPGYTPLQIAEENNDDFMIKLLKKYLDQTKQEEMTTGIREE